MYSTLFRHTNGRASLLFLRRVPGFWLCIIWVSMARRYNNTGPPSPPSLLGALAPQHLFIMEIMALVGARFVRARK